MEVRVGNAITSRRAAGQVLLYFVPLTFLFNVIDPTGPFFDIVLTYVVKDRLHAPLGVAAAFRLAVALPVYVAFLFGLVRDAWSPFGRGDRGYFLLFGPLAAAVLVGLAFLPLGFGTLTAGVLAVTVLTRFLTAAYQGLMASVAQQQALSGRLAVVWQVTSFSAAMVSSGCSGAVLRYGSTRAIFVGIGLAAVGFAALGFWRPTAVFADRHAALPVRRPDVLGDLRRLAGHRAVYPAVAIMLMFQFSPGSGVVLQYYLVDVLHGSDAVYGYWYAVFLGGFLPVMALYGWLCLRVRFDRLLWISAILTVPQVLPLVFIRSAEGALWLALPIGMLGGLMWAAINDLAMRSCPPGLHGTLMMAVAGVNALGIRGGDLVGAWIYGHGGRRGFVACALVTTAVYLALLLVVRCVPASVSRTRDGEWSVEGAMSQRLEDRTTT